MVSGTNSNVVVCSMFARLDGASATERAMHLLGLNRPGGSTRFCWLVARESGGETFDALCGIAREYCGEHIDVLYGDTKIPLTGVGLRVARIRLSEEKRCILRHIRTMDLDYAIFHESDLIGPKDTLTRLIDVADENTATAGWPVISVGGKMQFYDTWAYRVGPRTLRPSHPYCQTYQEDEPFEVDSFGSVWCVPAWALQEDEKCWPRELACLDMCAGLREKGVRLLVDPTLVIEQPTTRREAFY